MNVGAACPWGRGFTVLRCATKMVRLQGGVGLRRGQRWAQVSAPARHRGRRPGAMAAGAVRQSGSQDREQVQSWVENRFGLRHGERSQGGTLSFFGTWAGRAGK